MKEIVTPKRITGLILAMVFYEMTFAGLLFAQTGPPYDAFNIKRLLYLICSFSGPSCICFAIVVVTTSVLVAQLRQNLAWRNEATKQSARGSRTSKEQRVARSVIFISSIFIVCFIPNVVTWVTGLVYPKYDIRNPYWGNLTRIMFIFCMLFQSANSTVNIFVYYRMSTKYREVFDGLFRRMTN